MVVMYALLFFQNVKINKIYRLLDNNSNVLTDFRNNKKVVKQDAKTVENPSRKALRQRKSMQNRENNYFSFFTKENYDKKKKNFCGRNWCATKYNRR